MDISCKRQNKRFVVEIIVYILRSIHRSNQYNAMSIDPVLFTNAVEMVLSYDAVVHEKRQILSFTECSSCVDIIQLVSANPFGLWL